MLGLNATQRAPLARACAVELEHILDLAGEHPALTAYVAEHSVEDGRPPVLLLRRKLDP